MSENNENADAGNVMGELPEETEHAELPPEQEVAAMTAIGEALAPLDWSEMAPFSSRGMLDLIADLLLPLQLTYFLRSEFYATFDDNALRLGAFRDVDDDKMEELLRYAVDRRPTPEVLFNKLREIVAGMEGEFDQLAPHERASFELAARIIPALADFAEAMNAQIVAKCPPAPQGFVMRPVDIEDTIFEEVDGLDDIDHERANAQRKADEAAAARAAEKPAKKKRSIADGGGAPGKSTSKTASPSA